MTDPIAEAWRAFASSDQRVQAPPYLEARVLAAIAERHESSPAATGMVAIAFASAAAIAVLVTVWPPRPTAPVEPLAGRPMAIAALAAPVSPARPRSIAPIVEAPAITADWIAMHDELPVILMMLDSMTALESEPLQLVRLRIPRQALNALGVPLFEPDSAGLVDVDVLIGEDGLPKDVRRIRVTQEEQ